MLFIFAAGRKKSVALLTSLGIARFDEQLSRVSDAG